MNKIKLSFLIILICLSKTFSQTNFSPKFSAIISKENGLKLLNQCSRYIPTNVDTYFDLSENEILELHNNFKKIYKIKSNKCCVIGLKISNLENYRFQYVGVIIKGKKNIYINAFPTEDLIFEIDWRINPLIVCDGGDSFWGVLYSLENNKFSKLAFNGSI